MDALQKKTVRVRIAVAVNSEGTWAIGASYADDNWARNMALECIEPTDLPEHVVFVEADVPLPGAVTIEATVEDDNGEG